MSVLDALSASAFTKSPTELGQMREVLESYLDETNFAGGLAERVADKLDEIDDELLRRSDP